MSEITAALRSTVESWIALDPDPDTVAELRALLHAGDADGLGDRFATRLAFGTAGLRGPIGAGSNRMNRLVVRQTAAGLADHLLAAVPHAATRGVVIGYDARTKSDVFAQDTARVLAARGIRALLCPFLTPTPVLAFAVVHLGTAAGVQVTASHNPPADNGYKVYWGDGAQIVPPMDDDIARAIDRVATAPDAIELAPADHPLIESVEIETVRAYLRGVDALDPRTSTPEQRAALPITYTAMHGVGWVTFAGVMHHGGFTTITPVESQRDPDPAFPTVAFPNPEEKGALDLALETARRTGSLLVLANDPDADRCAAAVPDPNAPGGWRQLPGDEIGWLLADHLLRVTAGSPRRRLVCTTIVSSSLLEKMAREHDVDYVETLTGFKWLARAELAHPEHQAVFAYEEALGYCVGDLVRDKDGLSAALALADLAATLHAAGSTMLERLAEIEARFGRHDTEQWSLRFDGSDAQQQMQRLMERLRASLPSAVAGQPVTEVRDLVHADPPADVVALLLGDRARITVRPSGTEPKCKVYFEVVARDGETPLSIPALRAAMAEVLGVPAD